MGAEWEDPFNILGFAGGVVLATALLPQIYLAHKRGSTADISYMWQAVYIVGLLTLMIYYAHFRLWPVFYPMAFEMCSLLYLTGLKILFEVIQKRPKPADSNSNVAPSDLDMSSASRSGRLFRAASNQSLEGGGGRSRMSSRSSFKADSSFSSQTAVAREVSHAAAAAAAAVGRKSVVVPSLVGDEVKTCGNGTSRSGSSGNRQQRAAAAAAAIVVADRPGGGSNNGGGEIDLSQLEEGNKGGRSPLAAAPSSAAGAAGDTSITAGGAACAAGAPVAGGQVDNAKAARRRQ